MQRLLASAPVAAGIFLLSGCVTYPYSSSFAACDNAAGQCYRGCEDYEGTPDYQRCHADCDFSADRCFDSAYDPYRSAYYGGYGPSPWYGSYGAWYPDRGYSFSFSSGYYSDPYRSHRSRRPRGGSSHGGGYPPGGYQPPSGGSQPVPPPQSPPPQTQPETPPVYTPPPSPQTPSTSGEPAQSNRAGRPNRPSTDEQKRPD